MHAAIHSLYRQSPRDVIVPWRDTCVEEPDQSESVHSSISLSLRPSAQALREHQCVAEKDPDFAQHGPEATILKFSGRDPCYLATQPMQREFHHFLCRIARLRLPHIDPRALGRAGRAVEVPTVYGTGAHPGVFPKHPLFQEALL